MIGRQKRERGRRHSRPTQRAPFPFCVSVRRELFARPPIFESVLLHFASFVRLLHLGPFWTPLALDGYVRGLLLAAFVHSGTGREGAHMGEQRRVHWHVS